jgi:hypothetical protein
VYFYSVQINDVADGTLIFNFLTTHSQLLTWHTPWLDGPSIIDDVHSASELPTSCVIRQSNEDHSLLVCDAVQSDREVSVFERHFLPPSRHKMKAAGSYGTSYLSARPHGITFCKIINFKHPSSWLQSQWTPRRRPAEAMTTVSFFITCNGILSLPPANRKYVTFRS